MAVGIRWEFETFAEYLDMLEAGVWVNGQRVVDGNGHLPAAGPVGHLPREFG